MGRSLPGVSAMPLPFPAQVLTLKLPLARELPQPEKHHPTRSSELPFPDGIAAVAAVGLVVSPKHRELRAEVAGGEAAPEGSGQWSQGQGGNAAQSPRVSHEWLFFDCSCSQREA